MNPVEPVAAIAAAGPVAPLSGPGPAQPLSPTAPGGPSIEELTNRFRAMMDAPDPVERTPSGPNESLLTHMMANGEEFLRHTHEKVAELRAQSPYMSPQEFVAASIEVSNSASIGAFRLQAATSVASGTNKSMQSLLKNQ
jgi:type III secretion inner rod protein HrpB2